MNHEGWRWLVDADAEPIELLPDRRPVHRRPRADLRRAPVEPRAPLRVRNQRHAQVGLGQGPEPGLPGDAGLPRAALDAAAGRSDRLRACRRRARTARSTSDLGPDVPAAQMAFWMRELSEIVLLDFIFSQQDRVGNIDFTPYYYWAEDGRPEAQEGQAPRSRATATCRPARCCIRRTNLNDNDAGGRVQYANFAKIDADA